MIVNVSCHESADECAAKIEILETIKARLLCNADRNMVEEVLSVHVAAHKAWRDAEEDRYANDPKIKAFMENIGKHKVIYMRRPLPLCLKETE